jgi:hypothetical protein
VRLSLEEVQNRKSEMLEAKKLMAGMKGENLFDKILDYVDTIEAQQQDIEQQETAIENMKVYLYDKEKENGQLQAQVAIMREALSEAISIITSGRLCSIGSFNNTYSAQISASSVDRWTKALSSDAGKDYHNPTDESKLIKLFKLLEISHLALKRCNRGDIPVVRDTLELLDKALGGQEDGI